MKEYSNGLVDWLAKKEFSKLPSKAAKKAALEALECRDAHYQLEKFREYEKWLIKQNTRIASELSNIHSVLDQYSEM